MCGSAWNIGYEEQPNNVLKYGELKFRYINIQPKSNMKKNILTLLLLSLFGLLHGQTNTFPTSGNVGIGTTSPNKLLELSAGYGSTILSLQRNNTNTTGTIGDIGFKNSDNYFVASIGASGDGGNTGGELVFRTMTASDKTNTFDVTERMRIDNSGNVGIGTNDPKAKLSVNGTIISSEIKVLADISQYPDFVFSDNYKLRSIKEVEKYIETNKHLPDIPKANEVTEGIALGEMNNKLLQKIEELTLYTIEQDKAIEELKQAMKLQSEEIEKLKAVSK